MHFDRPVRKGGLESNLGDSEAAVEASSKPPWLSRSSLLELKTLALRPVRHFPSPLYMSSGHSPQRNEPRKKCCTAMLWIADLASSLEEGGEEGESTAIVFVKALLVALELCFACPSVD